MSVTRFKYSYIEASMRDPYPSGYAIDMSHGAVVTCTSTYENLRSGLYRIQCRPCGIDTIAYIGGTGGTVKMACNITKSAPPLGGGR